MSSLRPGAAFAGTALDIATLKPGAQFGRIFHARYPDPLAIGKTPSRFSGPRRRTAANRFGVLYFGSSLNVCFIESVVCDRRNGAVEDYPIEERELHDRRYAEIGIKEEMLLVDLRGDGPLRMGVPSDVAGSSRQSLARLWSVAFHEHPAVPDGIIYPSRLNGETNLAVFDRSIAKLGAVLTTPLMSAAGLARVLGDLKVALV